METISFFSLVLTETTVRDSPKILRTCDPENLGQVIMIILYRRRRGMARLSL